MLSEQVLQCGWPLVWGQGCFAVDADVDLSKMGMICGGCVAGAAVKVNVMQAAQVP